MEAFKPELIRKILQAIEIKEGDMVLLHFWGEDSDREVLHHFSYEVASLGASPLELQQSRSTNGELFNSAKKSSFPEKYFSFLDAVDIVIDICMYRPVIPGPQLLNENKDIYRGYMGQLFSTLMKKQKFVQIRIPTVENAMDSNLEPEDFIEKMNKAYDIDYKEMKEKCQNKIEQLKNENHVQIHTGDNCCLSFELEGRTWIADSGDGDLPCGEVFIAPLEDKTNGMVYFKLLSLDDGTTLNDVTLTIKNGIVENSDSDKFNDFLKELPQNGNVVCELGIGLNPSIEEITGFTALDEKMAGTFHIAIGMNTLFGGINESPIHMDFVGKGELLFQ